MLRQQEEEQGRSPVAVRTQETGDDDVQQGREADEGRNQQQGDGSGDANQLALPLLAAGAHHR